MKIKASTPQQVLLALSAYHKAEGDAASRRRQALANKAKIDMRAVRAASAEMRWHYHHADWLKTLEIEPCAQKTTTSTRPEVASTDSLLESLVGPSSS